MTEKNTSQALIFFLLTSWLTCTTTYVAQKTCEIKITEPTGEIKEVVAFGTAAITGTADIARDHAISDALRKAVEQGVGVFINSETAVKNFTLLKDEIYSNAQGYVASYRIIDEEKEKDLYRVKIIAKVKLDNIEDDLVAIGLLLKEKGRPRLMFVLKEFKGETTEWEETSDIETMMIERFTAKGFPVLDAAMVKRNLAFEQIRLMLEGDDKTAAALGLKLGAEIVITGRATLAEQEKTLAYTQSPQKFYQTRINVRAINTETAEILTATTTVKDLPFSQENSKLQAAWETSDKMIKAILEKWQREANITQIYITGAEYSEIQKLIFGIKTKMRGVDKLIQRDYTNKQAVLELITNISTQEVLEELLSKNLSVKLKVLGFSGNRIDLLIEK